MLTREVEFTFLDGPCRASGEFVTEIIRHTKEMFIMHEIGRPSRIYISSCLLGYVNFAKIGTLMILNGLAVYETRMSALKFVITTEPDEDIEEEMLLRDLEIEALSALKVQSFKR